MVDVDAFKKQIDEYIESEQYSIDLKKMEHRKMLEERNIEYIRNMGPEKRIDAIRKLIKKYSSEEYINRERSIGAYEPRCPLYDVLFGYAVKYCTASQYNLNEYFGEEQYDIDGIFVIGQIYGQGSFIYCYEVPSDRIIPHDFKDDPKELVIVLDPEGNKIKVCNYHIELLDILVQIKTKQLAGYTIKYKDNTYEITSTGKIKGVRNLYERDTMYLRFLTLNHM